MWPLNCRLRLNHSLQVKVSSTLKNRLQLGIPPKLSNSSNCPAFSIHRQKRRKLRYWLTCIFSVFGWRPLAQPYTILGPLSLKSPYLRLEAIFFRSWKFCCFFEHRRNFWELFSHLAAKLGVLLVVRVEAISESLDLAVKSGGRETKKARGAPTTSQYRRKMKLGEMKDWSKSRRKTVRYRSPTTRTPISWTLLVVLENRPCKGLKSSFSIIDFSRASFKTAIIIQCLLWCLLF